MDFTRASAVNNAFQAGKNIGRKELLEELKLKMRCKEDTEYIAHLLEKMEGKRG